MTEVLKILKKAEINIDVRYPDWPTNTAIELRSIISREGIESCRSIDHMENLMNEAGIGQLDLRQISLVLEASSIRLYLNRIPDGLTAIDINNIVRSAINGGLNENTSRLKVAELLYGMGVPLTMDEALRAALLNEKWKKEEKSSEISSKNCPQLYMPPYVYKGKLEEIEKEIESTGNASNEQISFLYAMSQAGVAEADGFIGRFYYYGISMKKDTKLAIYYLRRAADQGIPFAMGLLADILYENGDFEEALFNYSRPGVLNENIYRIDRMKDLYDKRNYVEKMKLKWIIALIGLFFCVFWIFPFISETLDFSQSRHILSRIVGTLIAISICGLIWKQLQKKPISCGKRINKTLTVAYVSCFLIALLL